MRSKHIGRASEQGVALPFVPSQQPLWTYIVGLHGKAGAGGFERGKCAHDLERAFLQVG